MTYWGSISTRLRGRYDPSAAMGRTPTSSTTRWARSNSRTKACTATIRSTTAFSPRTVTRSGRTMGAGMPGSRWGTTSTLTGTVFTSRVFTV